MTGAHTELPGGRTAADLLAVSGDGRPADADVTLPVECREAWGMDIDAVLLHGTSAGLGESHTTIELTTSGLEALVYLVVIPSAIGYLVYFDFLDRLGPIDVNLVSYVNPVFASLIGWVVLGEQRSLTTIGGFVVVFAGFVLMKQEEFSERLRYVVDQKDVV